MIMPLEPFCYFLIGFFGALLISRFGHFFHLTDIPNDRSSHTMPTPKGGGIGILVSFILASVVSGISPFIWAFASGLSLISFYGDFVHVSRRLRLLIQIIVSCLCIRFSEPFTGFMAIFFWSLFISGTANIYNFMDGINGIAGVTVVCASVLVYMAFGLHDAHILVFFAIGLACLGFLPFNIPNARVFMGDVGSILIGFWYGFLVFRLSSSPTDFIFMISLMMPFYVDSIGTIILRLINGENIASPHRKHLYQILSNEAGIAHHKVSIAYGAVQFFIGCMSITTFRLMGDTAGLCVSGASAAVMVFVFIRLRLVLKGGLF